VPACNLPRHRGRSKGLGLIARPRADARARNDGIADTLDEAKEAFRAAWDGHG
jgi:hypothetical protein